MPKYLDRTEEEWRAKLTPEQYRVLREKGTERPFSGRLLYNKKKGTYLCAACGADLFSSETKFDSGSGWPSFREPIEEVRVREAPDESLGMKRTEISCSRCGGHLGHVFEDGPAPSHARYCVNSLSLRFVEDK